MGQTTDQIEDQIQTTRGDLKSNFEELETRVKSATDWRHHFREHTGIMVALAFGGGWLLSTMTKGGGSERPRELSSGAAVARGPRHEVHRTFESIAGALVGTAATKLKGVLGEIVPGFADHLAQRERDGGGDLRH